MSGAMPWLRENVPMTEPSLGADRIEIVGRLEAAGAGHVLRHDGGMARNVLAEMARHQPSIGIVAAADAVADEERDSLALVEVLDAGGASGLRRSYGVEHDRESASARPETRRRL